MKDDPSAEHSSKRTDRRTVLKAGAIGVTGLISGSGFASAEISPSGTAPRGSNVHAATAVNGKSVSEKQRHELRKRAVRDYERKNGRSLDAIPAGTHEDSPGAVVAYAFGFDANGSAHEYVGLADEETTHLEAQSGRAEALIHDRFTRRTAELASDIAVSEQRATTESNQTITNTQNMSQFAKHRLEYASDPYGVAGMTNYWYTSTKQDEKEAHAFHTPAGFEPGTSAFDSDYENDWGRVQHRWDEGEMNADVDYGQWEPYGTKSGSTSKGYSISVSIGYQTGYVTAGFSWTYTQPNVEVVDESSAYNEYNQWQLKINADWGDDTRTNFVGFKPSSLVTIDNWDPSMGEKQITKQEVSARFDNGEDHFKRLYSWYGPTLYPA
ncbi:hypothetical protein [Haladaptatus sp. DYF46]|uniref:hypothetical protein n=1 Tax=Haladaptatus sp. DYF46 TaxID=2886041 RepID=UPI001E2F3696|nr:hypothetical protein [Haladaptatus sp. DYF46]